uniref:ATP synthase F0 subunit 8 n=1 Tax=Anurida maritima TaxID=64695 RepID=UPI0022FD9C70|nr:ATP synthase F0 subunit 8 [Anurida maritima]WBK17676.1 ATP synthase F0 subunit 8 [Anurida maritima]
MPQMSPINWLLMSLVFTATTVIILTKMYFLPPIYHPQGSALKKTLRSSTHLSWTW